MNRKPRAGFFDRFFCRFSRNRNRVFLGSVFRLSPKNNEIGKKNDSVFFSVVFPLSPTPITPIYLYGNPVVCGAVLQAAARRRAVCKKTRLCLRSETVFFDPRIRLRKGPLHDTIQTNLGRNVRTVWFSYVYSNASYISAQNGTFVCPGTWYPTYDR